MAFVKRRGGVVQAPNLTSVSVVAAPLISFLDGVFYQNQLLPQVKTTRLRSLYISMIPTANEKVEQSHTNGQ
jgi:hypothetical protein